MKLSQSQIDQLAKGFWRKEYTLKKLPVWLYDFYSKYLTKALYRGYGKRLPDEGSHYRHIRNAITPPPIEVEYGTTDAEVLSYLRANLFHFSAAKTFSQIQAIGDAMYQGNEIVPFNTFRDEVENICETYSHSWLETEYNTAYSSAQSAANWAQIEKDKKDLPYLRYSTVGGDTVCEICEPLDGLVLPVDDDTWNEFTPPNHFNCECLLEQLDEDDGANEVYTDEEKDDTLEGPNKNISDTFRNNPGKTGEVFTADHPYFEVGEKYKAFAEKNFNLPMPKVYGSEIKPDTDLFTAQQKAEKYLNGLTKESYYDLQEYTGAWGGSIGMGLRNDIEIFNKHNNDIIISLDKTLSNAPKFEGKVYRGLNFDGPGYSKFRKNFKIGNIWTDKSFMSTSYSKDVMQNFAQSPYQAQITIFGKNGVIIESASYHKPEMEVLFNKNSKFQILGIKEEEIERNDVIGNILYITLKEL